MSDRDPLGASARSLGAARLEVSLLSRGDRVRVRVAQGPSVRAPLVVLGAPDGSALSPFADAALTAWTSFATVAALDLPLCGARRSDKLSADAFRAGAPLASRLRAELELQLGSDLARLLDWLQRDGATQAAPVFWLALGRAAQLEPRPAERRLRAALRAESPGQPLAITLASGPLTAGPPLADFEPSPRTLGALAQVLQRLL